RTRAARPHDVGIHRVGRGKPRLAPAYFVPVAAGDGRAAAAAAEAPEPAAGRGQPAGAFIRAGVLLVAVDVVRNGVVHGDVVHLSVCQPHMVPGDAMIDAHGDAAVQRHRHAVGVGRVNPHVVGVAAGAG